MTVCSEFDASFVDSFGCSQVAFQGGEQTPGTGTGGGGAGMATPSPMLGGPMTPEMAQRMRWEREIEERNR